MTVVGGVMGFLASVFGLLWVLECRRTCVLKKRLRATVTESRRRGDELRLAANEARKIRDFTTTLHQKLTVHEIRGAA
jgi:hypothetical protein